MSETYNKHTDLTGNRVLVLAPHPDDETLGCGGVLSLHVLAKDPVKIIFLTDGRYGDLLNKYPNKAEYVLIREEEAKRACSKLQIHEVEFFRYPDRGLHTTIDSCARLDSAIEEFNPTLIYAPAQSEFHIDHKTTNELLWSVINKHPKCKMLAFYEIDPPLTPNVYIDISNVVDSKTNAIKEYKSQLEVYSYDTATAGLNQFRAKRFKRNTTHAEAFYLVKK